MSLTTMKTVKSESTCCGPSCCDSEKAGRTAAEMTAAVKATYGAVALSNLSNENAGVRAVAEAFG
jgi:hypothetical protein